MQTSIYGLTTQQGALAMALGWEEVPLRALSAELRGRGWRCICVGPESLAITTTAGRGYPIRRASPAADLAAVARAEVEIDIGRQLKRQRKG